MIYASQTFVTLPNRNTLQTVSSHAQAVYIWLCCMQNNTGRCWPSINKLAELTHVSPNTARRACIELENAGLIARFMSNRADKGQAPNLYEVLIKDTEPLQPAPDFIHVPPLQKLPTPPPTVEAPPPTVEAPPPTVEAPPLPQLKTNYNHIELKPNSNNVDLDKPRPTAKTYRTMLTGLIRILGMSPRTKLTDGRARKLAVRLKQFTYDEIEAAARHVADDPFLQGDNPAGKRYGDIDYLLRSDEVIDKWLTPPQTSAVDKRKEMLRKYNGHV